MNTPVLLAETPRAGDLGHRFLAPPRVSVTESEIAAYVQASQGDVVVGENFVAISREASQHPGGGVRVGREILIFAGIDLALTTGRSLASILASMQHCLNALANLVCHEIDWKCVNQAEVIVRRKELDEWLAALDCGPISNCDWRSGPRLLVDGTHKCVEAALPTSHKPAPRVSAALIVVIAVLAAVVGLLVGGISGVWYWRGHPANEGVGANDATQGDESPGGRFVEVPPQPENQPRGESVESDGIDQLVVAATKAGDPNAVVFLLSSLPSDQSVSSSARDSVIEGCFALFDSRRFDDALQITNAAFDLGARFSHDPMDNARLHDVRRKAQEGAAELDHEDKSLYESIRQSRGMPAVNAARQYLSAAPRKCMSRVVAGWLEWAEQPLVVQVTDLDVPWQGPFRLELSTRGREIAYSGQSTAKISDSQPLTFALSCLGVTRQDLPLMVTIAIERTNLPFAHALNRLEGQLQVREDLSADSRVSLRSARQQFESGEIRCRIHQGLDRPDLPEWSRNSQ